MVLMLAKVLREYRWATKDTVRGLAAKIGLTASTLSRFENEHGKGPDGATLSIILRWLLEEGGSEVG